jgi:hypothetical protein
LSFPEVVGKLLAAGVEYYHVDYVGLRKRFYSADGEMMATSINYEGLPPVAPTRRRRIADGAFAQVKRPDHLM